MTQIRGVSAAVAFAIIGSLVLAACGGGSSSSSESNESSSAGNASTSTTASSSEPIVVGAAIGQSGLLKNYDEPSFNSFKLKIDELNKEGGIDGRPVKIIVGNTQSNIAHTGQVAENLISEGAEILLVSCDFDYGSPAALVGQKAGILSVSLCAASPKFGTQAIGDLAFTFQPSQALEGAGAAAFALQEGWKKAYALTDDTLANPEGTCEAFEKFYPELGGEVIGTDSFKNEESNFSVMIEHVKSADPEVIQLCSYPPGGASLTRQLRAAGVDAPIIAGNAFDGTFWISAIPDLSDFFVTTSVSSYGDDPSKKVQQWRAAYTKAYGEPPSKGQSVIGYAEAEALQYALEQDGNSTEGKKLAEVLDEFDEHELVIGPTTFTPEDHIPLTNPVTIIEIKDGKPHFKTRIKPEVEITVADGVG